MQWGCLKLRTFVNDFFKLKIQIMNKLKKLQFIVPPKEETRLEDGDMYLLWGGLNCGDYAACSGGVNKFHCTSYASNGTCDGLGGTKCNTYV